MSNLVLPLMPSPSFLMRLYKVPALKSLSQNFLFDLNLTDKIVKAAGPIQNGYVCEVGPGPGGITRSILKQGPKHLLLIEKDKRFKNILSPLEEIDENYCKVAILYADILDFNMEPFLEEEYKKNWEEKPPNIHIIGNLPFNVSATLLFRWLKDISLRRNIWSYGRVKMTLTFQKEVADRIVSPILTKTRGRISVMCQNWCNPKIKFTMKGSSFVPRPDVDVSLVTFEPLVRPVIPYQFEMIEKVVRTIGNTRQKYISNGAKKLFPTLMTEKLTEELFDSSEVDPKMRSFQLTVEEYGRIIKSYKDICDKNPNLYDYDYRGKKRKREEGFFDDCDEGEEEEKEQVEEAEEKVVEKQQNGSIS